MPNVDGDLEQASAEEAADPSADASLGSCHLARDGVETVVQVGSHGVPLDIVPQSQERRQRVGHVEQRGRGHNRDEAKVVRDGGGDDESNGPPDWDDRGVHDLPTPRHEWRRVEDVHEDVVVKHLDADVAVQTGGNERRDQGDHVAGCLPAIGADALVAGAEAVLALVVVDEASVNKIDCKYEDLRAPHGLEKVARAPHLSHELDKQLGTSVRQHAGQKAVERAHQGVLGKTVIVHDGRIVVVLVRRDGCRIDSAPGGSQLGDGVVWRRMGNDTHGDEDDKQIQPHRKVGHQAICLESADLREEEAGANENHRTDSIAKTKPGHLRNVLAELDGDLTENEKQRERLHDVGDIASGGTPGSEREITVVPCREFMAIDAEENVPEEVAGVAGHEAKDSIQCNA